VDAFAHQRHRLEVIARRAAMRHRRAYVPSTPTTTGSIPGGQYQWRRRGEFHLFNPQTIAKLQHATRSGEYEVYKKYARLVNDQSKSLCTLRSMLVLKKPTAGADRRVEPAQEIVKRFKTGAMSFGSISAEAHETLAIAMNRIGGKSNTGEGGEEPRAYEDPNGDWPRARSSRSRRDASA
jgi:glutamate synthase domain-containing protein 2